MVTAIPSVVEKVSRHILFSQNFAAMVLFHCGIFFISTIDKFILQEYNITKVLLS